MADLQFPGIMASFQAAMENIAKARLRDTFTKEPLSYGSRLQVKEHGACYPDEFYSASPSPVRHSVISPNKLSMGIVGCLPDNVQKAIRSFSIKPGKQHFTISFPFMSDMISSCSSHTDVQGSDLTSRLSHTLYIDMGPEVISGFRSISTFMLNKQRTGMVIVLLTLFEMDTTEGVLRHFDSMIRMMVHPNTPITLWKHPVCVTDLDMQLQQSVHDICAQTILEVQHENIQNSFPGKSRHDLHRFLKDSVIASRFISYSQHYYKMTKLLTHSSLTDACHVITMFEHLRTGRCSMADFNKVDTYLKTLRQVPVKTLWLVWGHEQLSQKIFPVANPSRDPHFLQMSPQDRTSTSFHHRQDRLAVAHVSIKEGLKNIIESLKQQESNIKRGNSNHQDGSTPCSWCPKYKISTILDKRFIKEPSAFYRPNALQRRQTSTPYSDALKAVAVSPYRQPQHKTTNGNSKNAIRVPITHENSPFKHGSSCYTQRMPHLHSLYCDFFGTKSAPSSQSTEPSSTTTL